VLGGLAVIRARTGEGRAPRRGERREDGAQAEAHPAPEARGNPPPRQVQGIERRQWPELQRVGLRRFLKLLASTNLCCQMFLHQQAVFKLLLCH